MLDHHQEVFKAELGTLKGYEAKILVDPDARPRFHKVRPVPYTIKGKVEEELDCLQKEVIEPIQFADWAAPIVAVLKADRKSVRICGDFNRLYARLNDVIRIYKAELIMQNVMRHKKSFVYGIVSTT